MIFFLLGAIVVALVFGPAIEIFILSVAAALFAGFGGDRNSIELAIWAFIISIIVLVAIYKSRAGVILSALFSLFWGIVLGWSIHDAGASMFSYVAAGVAAFAVLYCYHEWKRDPAKYSKAVNKQENSE